MDKIPKNIFQTHKSKEYILRKSKILNAVITWKQWEPEYKYYFYDDKACEKFMSEKMEPSVYQAYQRLPLPVMKADLFRYCVIFYYGGIYADSDTICLLKPHLFVNDSLLTIVPENDTHLCNWVFSAPKGSPILKKVIDLAVERILLKKEIKGEHIIHELTGPGVFTDGIEEYLKEEDMPTFKNKEKYHKYPHDVLRVFHAKNFHEKMVIHLFAGQDEDGWCKERNRKLGSS